MRQPLLDIYKSIEGGQVYVVIPQRLLMIQLLNKQRAYEPIVLNPIEVRVNLERILIDSDSIGNYGIKKLIQLYLPKLQIVSLSNTNITADVVRLFMKKPNNTIKIFRVAKQEKFIHDYYLKNCAMFVSSYANKYFKGDDIFFEVEKHFKGKAKDY